MQPRYAHQVIDAGARKHLPLRLADGALVADRERRQHAGVRRVAERGLNACAHVLAHAFYPVTRTHDDRGEPPVGRTGPHVTRRANVAFEQPRLVIETMRIERAVRPPQAHGQLPPLARAQFGQCRALPCALGRAPPRNRHVAGNDGARCQHALDIELETQAAFVRLRHRRDHADDLDVLAFPFDSQLIGEPHLREPRGPRDSARNTAQSGHGGRAKRHRREPATVALNAINATGAAIQAPVNAGSCACCCSHHTPPAKPRMYKRMNDSAVVDVIGYNALIPRDGL